MCVYEYIQVNIYTRLMRRIEPLYPPMSFRKMAHLTKAVKLIGLCYLDMRLKE